MKNTKPSEVFPLILCLMVSFIQPAIAQREADSLADELKKYTTSDSARANLLVNLAEKIRVSDPSQSIFYATELERMILSKPGGNYKANTNRYLSTALLLTRYGIEKIKTIGDAYMCAGGLPVVNRTNAIDVVNAALEIQQFMASMKLQRITENRPYFELRLGIHTGPVVAGIVGIKKFQYDIWGDTVNLASRMESSGEVGKVNVSQMTCEKISDRFECTYRGKIEAKNKGTVDMYFVEGAKTAI